MKKDYAPIALFVYNRPFHTEKTLDALALNPEAKSCDLYIFCDGAKVNSSEEQVEKISAVQKLVQNEKRFRNTYIQIQKENQGLATSIINGVSELLTKNEALIVLEDDLITSPHFLNYMNEALERYKDEEQVACISAYSYPVKIQLPETFFLKGADCWGWASWKRAWQHFEPDGQLLLNALEKDKLTKEFDFEGSYPYTQMLKDQIEGKNDSWAIRWYASAFLRNQYCLYPGKSLVQNIGIDGSGTHSGSSTLYDRKVSERVIEVKKINIESNSIGKKAFIRYFLTLKRHNNSLSGKILMKIKNIIKP